MLGDPYYLSQSGRAFLLFAASLPTRKKITVFWRAVSLQIELDDLLLIHRLFQIQMEVREGHRYVTVF